MTKEVPNRNGDHDDTSSSNVGLESHFKTSFYFPFVLFPLLLWAAITDLVLTTTHPSLLLTSTLSAEIPHKLAIRPKSSASHCFSTYFAAPSVCRGERKFAQFQN